MHTVLVTGASSFVGGHLLSALRRRCPTTNVVGTSRDGRGGLAALELTDARAVRSLITQVHPDICIHLAALASVDQSFREPRAVWEVNLFGTLNVAEALLNAVPAARLVYASSAEVYGLSLNDGPPATENTLLQPANPYAAAKAAADIALGEMALRGLRVVCLRLFNHTGPGQSEHYVLPRLAAQVARIAAGVQPPIVHIGALDRWRDFLDVRDVVDAYLAAIGSQRVVDGMAMNVCSGVARRIGDILDQLLDLAEVKAEIVSHVSEDRQTDIRCSVGCAERAAAMLGWRPRIAWSETLRWLLQDWTMRVCGEA